MERDEDSKGILAALLAATCQSFDLSPPRNGTTIQQLSGMQ